MSGPTPFAVMISGGGRTLRNLKDEIDAGRLEGRITIVIASRECPGAEWARGEGLETVVEPGVIRAERLSQLLVGSGAEWGVLGGYLRLLDIPREWAGRLVNIHPALLPSFGGAGWYGERVHQGVIDAGCRVSGCTVHLCDPAYDTGPILAQACCPVLEEDTAASLGARVFELEQVLYPETLRALFGGRVSIVGRRARIIPG